MYWDDEAVVIRRGQLLCGQLAKRHLGAQSGGLVHVIALAFSEAAALEFISSVQVLAHSWMEESGFSVGLSDCVPSRELAKEVRVLVESRVSGVDRAQAECGGTVPFQEREAKTEEVLAGVLDTTGGIVQHQRGSSIWDMIRAGSKGSLVNGAQIMGCVWDSSPCAAAGFSGGRVLSRGHSRAFGTAISPRPPGASSGAHTWMV